MNYFLQIPSRTDTVVLISGGESGDQLWLTLLIALGSAIIGALVTIWGKRNEFQNTRDSLNLQRQIIEETRKNNENTLKAEVLRLRNLAKEYELNLDTARFSQFESSINAVEIDSSQKNFIVTYSKLLKKISPEIPPWVEDVDDYYSIVAQHIVPMLENVSKDIEKLLDEYPTVFVEYHDKFKSISGLAYSLNSSFSQIEFDDFHQWIEYVDGKTDELVHIHDELVKCMDLLKSDYIKISGIRKEFIKEQYEKFVSKK